MIPASGRAIVAPLTTICAEPFGGFGALSMPSMRAIRSMAGE
jgi:hypothetical protein